MCTSVTQGCEVKRQSGYSDRLCTSLRSSVWRSVAMGRWFTLFTSYIYWIHRHATTPSI